MKNLRTRFAFIAAILFAGLIRAQNAPVTQGDSLASTISLICFVDNIKTPQNQPIHLVVQLKWSGDLEKYDILPFDNPILQNLDIVGSGSSNTVSSVDSQKMAVREYTFTLLPQSMGMAYIEPIIIKYTDLTTDTDHVLTSNRIEVEVSEPVIKGRGRKWIVPALILVLLGLLAALLSILRNKRKKEALAQRAEAEQLVPLEDTYLQEITDLVDLSDPVLDMDKALAQMTRLLRRYLHEKFNAPGFEATTSEVIQYLYEKKFADSFVLETKELLTSADVAKFSGKGVSRAEVEKAYSIIENTFRKGRDNAIEWAGETSGDE